MHQLILKSTGVGLLEDKGAQDVNCIDAAINLQMPVFLKVVGAI